MSVTLHAVASDIRSGRRTPLEVLDWCLSRIDQYESSVRAWVRIDREDARKQAESATEEIRRGHYRGPLHGIPVGIKDIFDVFDQPTACGSRLWKQAYARQDATLVRRLREAGAVIVGKTVTTQYASFDPPPTRNPWNLTRTPGGSSSGSAAAVAYAGCLGAIGSQTGGSITRPASYCGVAGCKPSYGRVSLHGTLPLAHSMDHPGPIALCVRDLAILLQAIAGPDPLDPVCSDRPVPDYLTLLQRGGSPPRLGQLRGLFEERADARVRALMDRVSSQLDQAGAEIVEAALPAGFGEVLARHRTVMAVEAAQFHEPRLRRHPEDYDPNIRQLLEEGLACPAPEYARCKEHQARLRQEMQACFAGLDALLAPATTGPAPDAASTGDPAFNSPWSYTGLPVVSIPAGWTEDGLPLAVQLISRPFSEADLFVAAEWCEKALEFPRRDPPLG